MVSQMWCWLSYSLLLRISSLFWIHPFKLMSFRWVPLVGLRSISLWLSSFWICILILDASVRLNIPSFCVVVIGCFHGTDWLSWARFRHGVLWIHLKGRRWLPSSTTKSSNLIIYNWQTIKDSRRRLNQNPRSSSYVGSVFDMVGAQGSRLDPSFTIYCLWLIWTM